MENRADREKVMKNDEYVLDKLQQGRTDGMNVSGSGAKDIAIRIVSDYYN